MKNVEVYLSERAWEKKPTSEETKNFIAKPILNNRVSLTLKALAKEISEKSKVCMLGLFPKGTLTSGSGNQIEGQEVLMLDVDNTNKNQEHFTYEEALNHSFVKNNVSFMYKTLSNTEKHERFRMVIILDRKLLSKEEVSEVYINLFNLLRVDFKGQLDEGMKNANRLFFGGNTGYTVINWNNTFNPDTLMLDDSFFSPKNEKLDNKKSHIPQRIGSNESYMSDKHSLISVSDNPSIPNTQYIVYELLKQKQFSDVEKAILNKELAYTEKEFTSLEEFREDLNKDRDFSMKEFLDLPKVDSFLDIFHTEKSPSANVYPTDKGVELYICHSSSAKFSGDIVDVINKLTKEGTVKTLNRLAKWLNITIVEPLEITEKKEAIDWFKKELLSNDLKQKYPYVYKILWRYLDTFCTLLDIYCSQGYIYNEITEHYELLSYMSRDKINTEYAKHYGKKLSPVTLHTTINLMALTMIINKLSFNEIPRNLKTNLASHKQLNGYERHTDVIVIPKLPKNFMTNLNNFCKILSDTQFTKTALSKDYVVANYGVERADNTFAQTRPEDKQVSTKFQEYLKETMKIIDREFKKTNYIQEAILLDRLFLNFKRKNKTNSRVDIEMKYKQIRNSLVDGYAYERVKLTNDIRVKLSITETEIPKSKRPYIFVKPNSLD